MIEELADKVRALYGKNPKAVLEKLGVEVMEQPLRGRIREIYFGDFVVVKSQSEAVYRDYYLAHALGHHIIHKKGNYLYCDSIRHLNTIKKEGEAEDFAACFLIGRHTLTHVLSESGDSPLETVSANLQVAPEVLSRRIDVYRRGNIHFVAQDFIV